MTRTKPTEPALPMRERLKMIRERLNKTRTPPWPPVPKPQRVIKAEAIVAEFEKLENEREVAARAAYMKRRRAVEDALIMGDTPLALKLLHELEAQQ